MFAKQIEKKAKKALVSLDVRWHNPARISASEANGIDWFVVLSRRIRLVGAGRPKDSVAGMKKIAFAVKKPGSNGAVC